MLTPPALLWWFLAAELAVGYVLVRYIGPRYNRRLIHNDVKQLLDDHVLPRVKEQVSAALLDFAAQTEEEAASDHGKALAMASVAARQDRETSEAIIEAALLQAIGPGWTEAIKLTAPALWKKAVKAGPESAQMILGPIIEWLKKNGKAPGEFRNGQKATVTPY